jgi:apolipoprotein N-acyltransferase
VFAANPLLVQWYEYTGAFGGTIWILIVNFLVYYFIQHREPQRTTEKFGKILQNLRHLCAKKTFITLILTILLPMLISHIIYNTYKINQETPLEAVIVQQNVDPWTEQYEKTNTEVAELIIEMAAQKLTPNTELVICSESALPHTINELQLNHLDIYPMPSFQLFDELFQQYPHLNLVLGLSTVAFFNAKISSASRQFDNGTYAEYYNTSCLYIKNNIELYRKSRLVPGVERMP